LKFKIINLKNLGPKLNSFKKPKASGDNLDKSRFNLIMSVKFKLKNDFYITKIKIKKHATFQIYHIKRTIKVILY